MLITPYTSFGPLRFGHSPKDKCAELMGQPIKRRTTRRGREELEYDEWIVRFDSELLTFSEATLLPLAQAMIDGIQVTWDKTFLRQMCERDGTARDAQGFIVFPRLGIAVTGIHDDDDSQLAITVFCKDDLADWTANSVPYDFTSL